MAVDTPARIVILGAGPIGLEAALYARFLGYDVEVLERGEVAAHVRRWGHVRMSSPFGMNRSTLGLAALRAQDESRVPPPEEAYLTGAEWVRDYLQPLAETDLLADHIRTHTTVLAVSRAEYLKGEWVGDERREDAGFRILTRDRNGVEAEVWAEVVLDTTGVFGEPNWMGPGGAPALGEIGLRNELVYDLPDVIGTNRRRYAGRHTLVVGSGLSAATTVLALVQLAAEEPATRVTWVTRPRHGVERTGPVAEDRLNGLPERRKLVESANQLLSNPPRSFTHRWAAAVASLSRHQAGYHVYLTQEEGMPAEEAGIFDEVIANVGYRPDIHLYDELQVPACYLTQRPARPSTEESVRAATSWPDLSLTALRNPEPDFYVLGAKSFGRKSDFLVSDGLQQIQILFTLIGDRPDLNLYEYAKRLLT